MRATPQARLLVATLDIVSRYWGPLGVAVVVALEAFVFGPQGQPEAMLAAASSARRSSSLGSSTPERSARGLSGWTCST